jgi:hypothetical protein
LPKPAGQTPVEDEIVDAELVELLAAKPKPEEVPNAADAGSAGETPKPADSTHSFKTHTFLDPPTAPVAAKSEPKTPLARRMFEALLDPKSIQWMVILGGGLMVLGLIIWLASLGIFKSPLAIEAAIAIGSLALLAGGWYVVLRTPYHVAGRALTFLACAVLPLNLWYCHAQGLLTMDQGLWVASLFCCLLYAATVFVLRDSLFMYAVEVGATLTVLLLLASLSLASNVTTVSLALMALALISIHAERAFDVKAAVFTRGQYGLPLFWSGHIQLAASLLLLLACQIPGWMAGPASIFLDSSWVENSLGQRFLLCAGLWLVGAYAYLYSDIVVRRIGVYAFLAGFCLVMAQVTLIVGFEISTETVIILLSITALAATVLDRTFGGKDMRLARALPPLAVVLSSLPILLGVLIHLRATSRIVESLGWQRETGWLFVVAMLVVAVTSRISAWVFGEKSPKTSATYLCFSAGGLVVAAAGMLRVIGFVFWYQQVPLLMLIPIGYLIASRLWRDRSPERPLGWVAHAATAVILFHVGIGVIASMESLESVFRPQVGLLDNLLLGITLLEATVFYVLAAYVRRKSLNVYFAMICLCAGLWELMGYTGLFAAPYYTMVYALLGLSFLVIARVLGIESATYYEARGNPAERIRGKGLPAYQGGNAVLMVAFLAAVLQALARLAAHSPVEFLPVAALVITTAVSIVAIWLVPRGGWRRLYVTSSVALTVVTLLTVNVLIDLQPWQKLEIVCVAVGLLLLGASYIGRFQEHGDKGEPKDVVTAGFWLGSLSAALTLLIAVMYHRYAGSGPSLYDELALLTVTILMLVTGLSWQVKSTTLIGGGVLMLYLIVMIAHLAYQPQIAVGVYLAVGGALVFACGVGLSIYREKLLQLPEKIAKREGIFSVIGWR